MCFRFLRLSTLAALFFCQLAQPEARAWHDKTHLVIAEAAGFDLWYSVTAPDVTKSKKEFLSVEGPNHYCNNKADCQVTAGMVLEQAERYNKPNDDVGHLYGAIIASVREYFAMKGRGRYARYPLIFCAHYVGDLSMPLHNTCYNEFNTDRHRINDGIIESSVQSNIESIRSMMQPLYIDSEADLAREVAALAESACKLGARMEMEDRDMTTEEAYAQVTRSASLFSAILAWTDRAQSLLPTVTATAPR
ncbi:MAG: hypothetical protein HGA97_04695 [Chlorobiaceae bacterium]|jgi:hypothetical protein|nr:hypothetical protein [Chlorobiaceae bacterium]